MHSMHNRQLSKVDSPAVASDWLLQMSCAGNESHGMCTGVEGNGGCGV